MGNAVIYRPAYDAEVEYLESTGTQWIDTGVKPDSTYTFDCKVAFTSAIDGNYVPWGCRDMQNNAITAQCFLFVSNMTSYDGTKLRLITTNSWADRENWNSGIVPIPNTMYELVGMTSVSNMEALNSDIAIFGFITNGVNNSGSSRCRIGYWKCYSNGVLVRDMIPVRIGSVGYLYDKVSKQLFANKGTGNFILGNDVVNAVIPQQRCVLYFGNQRSVGYERIYEEYEWLKVSVGTSVDMAALPVDSPNLYFKHKHISGINYHYFRTTGDGVDYDYYYETDTSRCAIWNLSSKTSVYINRDIIVDEIVIDCNSSNRYFNGYDIPIYGSTIKQVSIISRYRNGFEGLISSIYIDGVERYIPCRLLRPIPATLDGNGIARQAGECGMWDKVGNRFYGNVANSGTFTVKGPKCYEEYEWLKAEIPIGVAMMSLPINSSTFNCTIEHTGAQANLPHLYSDGYIYFTNSSNMDMIAVWNVSEANIPFSASVGSLMIIESNEEYFKVNDISIIKYGFPITRMIIQSSYNSNNATTTKTSKITVDGIERYVPCKLTHGIPASMDANGIARPAGTCGMWDKVNDKFYGNVASSGTFTVSND